MTNTVVGIPRALLFHIYGDLWTDFFDELGVKTILSPPTNKEIVERGVALSVDEACFSSKVFLGHIAWLQGKCDIVFLPRFENAAVREDFCPRIFGMYDVAKHTFKINFLTADVNYLHRKRNLEAFIKMGTDLGFKSEASAEAYNTALNKWEDKRMDAIRHQEELLEREGLRVLLVSHPYNSLDAYIGADVVRYLQKNDIAVIFADLADPKVAKEKTKEKHGNRVYWKINSDLLGGFELYRDRVDGIVLLTTFPCGPDSIFNEMLIRTLEDKPALSLMVDELDATAGLQTRLESFVDILKARTQ